MYSLGATLGGPRTRSNGIPRLESISVHPFPRRRCLWPSIPLSLILAGGLLLPDDNRAAGEFTPAVPAATSSEQANILVERNGDLLSVHAREADLTDLLREVALRADIALAYVGPTNGTLSVSLHRLSVPDAMAHILKHHNYVLLYPVSSDVEQRPASSPGAKLWVFRRTPEPVARETAAWVSRYTNAWAMPPIPPPTRVIYSSATSDDDVARPRTSPDPARQPNDHAIAALVSAIRDPDPVVRAAAVRMLGDSGREHIAEAIAPALDDDARSVRVAAIDALADVGSKTAVGHLASTLAHEDAAMRQYAVDALADIGNITAVQLLQLALTDHHPGVRDAAREALADLKEED